MFSVSTKIKYSYQSEYVTLKDLRVMLLRIGRVGIPIMSQTPLFTFRKNSNKQINLQKTKSLSLTSPYRVEKLVTHYSLPCGKTYTYRVEKFSLTSPYRVEELSLTSPYCSTMWKNLI